MAIQANMHEAKSNLSQLADRAAEGETVIIAKAGKPYVQLVAIRAKRAAPVPPKASSPCRRISTRGMRSLRRCLRAMNEASAAGYPHIAVVAD